MAKKRGEFYGYATGADFTRALVEGRVGKPSPAAKRQQQQRIAEVAAGFRRKRATKRRRRGWLEVTGKW